MEVVIDPQVSHRWESYPPDIKEHLNELRELILTTATEVGVKQLTETLKWNELSYVAKKGSTIRIDWKERTPDQYAMYFTCSSGLVAAFRDVFGDTFEYEKNRAILFDIHEDLPTAPLKKCITAALLYHTVKKQPLLGLV